MKYFVQGIENNWPGLHCLSHFLQFGLRDSTVCQKTGLSCSYPFMGRDETYLYTPHGDPEMFEHMKRVWEAFLALPDETRSVRRALLLAFGETDEYQHDAAQHLDLKTIAEILLNPEDLGRISDWVTDAEREATKQRKQERLELFRGLVELAANNRDARPFITAAVQSGAV
jgi:hypothetical protein